MALTPKQEKFAQGIASGLSQADAYRASYDCDNSSDGCIYTEASLLMDNPNISQRIEHLQKPIAERVGRTLEQHIARLEELARGAEGVEQFSAAMKGEENIGKVLGYYVNKTEVSGSLTLEQMTDEDLDKKIAEKLTTLQKN